MILIDKLDCIQAPFQKKKKKDENVPENPEILRSQESLPVYQLVYLTGGLVNVGCLDPGDTGQTLLSMILQHLREKGRTMWDEPLKDTSSYLQIVRGRETQV